MSDQDRHEPSSSGDDFWGSTPDWTGRVDRPRVRRKDRGDITGSIKRVWDSALSAGSDATREHRIIDAADQHSELDAATDQSLRRAPAVHLDADDLSDADWFAAFSTDDDDDVVFDTEATTEVPVVDARATRRDGAGAVDLPSRLAGIDPLLARVGAVAVVTTLLVPLMLGLRGAESDDTLSSSAAPAEVPATIADVATEATEPASPVALDPSELPPAIPARGDDAQSTTAQTESSDESKTAVSDADASGNSTNASPKPSGSDSVVSDLTESPNSVEDGAVADTPADRTDPVCDVDFEVRPGDFWIGIADEADVDLADLLTVNDATVDTALFPGREICLPAGATVPAPATTTPPTTEAPPATTTAPTTTTTTTTTEPAPTDTIPPGADATPEQVQQIIRDVWPDELEEQALEIAFRESRYVPTAKNFCCYGIFQIYWEVHDVWLDDIGVTSAQQLYDPATNAKAAYALYQRAGGWGPWQL